MNDKKVDKKKKIKKVFKYILLSLLIISILWFLVFLFEYTYDNVLYGYYKGEAFIQHPFFQGYDEYYKYYYTEKEDRKFYSRYDKVTKENIETIKLFREHFKDIMIFWNKLDKYDFYNIEIKENDYYLLFSDDLEKPYLYELYYYDTQTHILYLLHTSD